MLTRQVGLPEIDKRGPLPIRGEHRLADEEEGSKWPECRGSETENSGKQLLKGQTRVTLLTLKCQRKSLGTAATHYSRTQGEHVVSGKRGRTWIERSRAGPGAGAGPLSRVDGHQSNPTNAGLLRSGDPCHILLSSNTKLCLKN